MTVSLGTVTVVVGVDVVPDGVQLQVNTGSVTVTGTAVVTVTGTESTVETGQLIAQGWTEVDADTDDTWTEV